MPLWGVYISHFDQISVKMSVLGLLHPNHCTDRGEIWPLLHAKFHPNRCNVSPLWGEKPQAPFTRYNRLSNRFDNRFDNRLYRVYKHSTDCQTRLTTGLTKQLYRVYSWLSNRLYNQLTGLTNGCIM